MESMSCSTFKEWEAFYVLEASEQNPEVTEWDDEASALRKLNRTVQAKEGARPRSR